MKKFILCAILVLFGISTSYAVGSGSVWITGKNVVIPPPPGWGSATYAISFDGVDDFASATLSVTPTGNGSRTVMLWILDYDASGNDMPIMLGDGNPIYVQQVWGLMLQSTNLGFVYGHLYDANFTIPTRAAVWRHYAMTAATGQLSADWKLYVDGELATYSGGFSAGSGLARNQLSIATSMFSGWFTKAKMAEIAIFRKDLSQAEIQSIFRTRMTGAENGLVALYHCDEGSGNYLLDSGPYAQHLTVYNGATPGATWVSR